MAKSKLINQINLLSDIYATSMEEKYLKEREEILRKERTSPEAYKKHIQSLKEIAEKKYKGINLPLFNCHLCPLFNKEFYYPYNFSFYGDYKDNIDVMFIGEALGSNEEKNRLTFCGKAGERIKGILDELKFNHTSVFYNTVQCRPPNNRDPIKNEVLLCHDILDRAIEYFNPKLIITLGRVPLERILGESVLKSTHGKIFWYKSKPVIPTYHPAAPDYGQAFLIDYIKSDVSFANTFLDNNIVSESLDRNYKCISTSKEFDEFFNFIINVDRFAFDIETSGLKFWKDEIIGISFSYEKNKSYYIPLKISLVDAIKKYNKEDLFKDKIYSFWGEELEKYIIEKLKLILTNKSRKTGHYVKFDMKFIKYHWKIDVSNLWCDSALLMYLKNENYSTDLESITDLYYEDLHGFKTATKLFVSNKKKEEADFSKIPLELLWRRGCGDADATFRIVEDNFNTDKKIEQLLVSYYNPLIYIFVDAEIKGIKIDVEQVNKLRSQYKAKIRDLESKIFTAIGKKINLSSSVQLSKVLYEELKYPVSVYTATNNPSSGKEALRILAQSGYEFCELIRERNSKVSWVNTYFDGFTANLDNFSAHYSFDFIEKGNRFKASNISILTTPRDKYIRGMFKARDGHAFVHGDYSQLELKVLAWYSQDPVLLKEFYDGVDIHRLTSSILFNRKAEDITKEQRNIGKMVNFAGFYGAIAETIKRQVDDDLPFGVEPIDIEVVKKFVQYRDNKYRGVKHYLSIVEDIALRKRELTTIFGHKRRFSVSKQYLQDMKAKADMLNQARNYIIQSTANTICHIAVIKMNRLLKNYKTKFLFSMHDMIMLESPLEEKDMMKRILKTVMEEAVSSLSIKLVAEIEEGDRWGIKI